MRVSTIIPEDFTNYKIPAMFIGSISCSGKCCTEANLPLSTCQNDGWRSCAPIEIDIYDLCVNYLKNDLTKAIVFGGLEPLEQLNELLDFLEVLRNYYKCSDMVVIYTGYYPNEIKTEISKLSKYENIILKFGRYIPSKPSKYDDVLGVKLASDNQYAKKIS